VADPRPIGTFDSGVGGLSILRELRTCLPHEHILYIADQQHVPYGSRELDEVRALSFGISRSLIEAGAKLIVVACNTASAAALHALREEFPQVLFVGMEPAVKPAAAATRTRAVGVLATPATFQGALYASVVERFAGDVAIHTCTLPGLVDRIEKGELDGKKTRTILKQGLTPLLEKGVDTIVLACTHYPFIIPQLRALVGPQIDVIDPAPAIARRTASLLDEHALRAPPDQTGITRYYTSAHPSLFAAQIARLLGVQAQAGPAFWSGDKLELPE
jgi:glutamate racemase